MLDWLPVQSFGTCSSSGDHSGWGTQSEGTRLGVRGEALSLPSLAPLKASGQTDSLASVTCSHLQDQQCMGQLGSPRHQPLDQPLVLECVGD